MSANEPLERNDSGIAEERNASGAEPRAAYEKLFRDYQLDSAFDEMRTPDGGVRPEYLALVETLAQLPYEELQRRKQSADLSFLTQGITSTVTELACRDSLKSTVAG